jgi:uncharacterized membrane protein
MNKEEKKDMMLFYLKLFLFTTAMYGIMFVSIVFDKKNNADNDNNEYLFVIFYCIATSLILRSALKTYFSKDEESE